MSSCTLHIIVECWSANATHVITLHLQCLQCMYMLHELSNDVGNASARVKLIAEDTGVFAASLATPLMHEEWVNDCVNEQRDRRTHE